MSKKTKINMDILKEAKPIARKEYECMLCHGMIERGQRYFRQTNAVYGEAIYDFISHIECEEVADELGMFDDCDPDDGLNDEAFCEAITQYIIDKHSDKETGDIQSDWQGLTKYQEVCKIYNELKQ